MTNWEQVWTRLVSDSRYLEGVTYGTNQPRRGHAEGSVRNHIEELEGTLGKLRPILSEEEVWKLRILIHAHDSMKLEGKRQTNGKDVGLQDERSHCSLGKKFLSEFTTDEQLLAIVQYHDEGHALWTAWTKKRKFDEMRLARALAAVMDLKPELPRDAEVDLYILFTIIDSATKSKMEDRSPKWFVDVVNKYIPVPRAYEALELLGIRE